jgi:hypothetical protein
VIDAATFRRFLEDNTPSKRPGDGPVQRRHDQQYVQRSGLVYLLRHVFLLTTSLTNSERLMLARLLSAAEVQNQPQRWAERFEALADEQASEDLKQILSLASDACAVVQYEQPGDIATATDGNGDDNGEEIAA